MLTWLNQLFCPHNKTDCIIYYNIYLDEVRVYAHYSCKRCNKQWDKLLNNYIISIYNNIIESLRLRGVKSIEEVYNERISQ